MSAVPLLLQARLDALAVALQGNVASSVFDALYERQGEALQLGTPVAYDAAGIPFQLGLKGASGKPFCLSNADLSILVGLDPHEYCVVLTFRAVFLATTTIEAVQDLTKRLAHHFLSNEPRAFRVRRVDLCADVTGVVFTSEDRESFVGRARGFVRQETRDVSADGSTRFTGLSIAMGNPLSARLYDKTEELRVKFDAEHEKRQTEEHTFRSAVWDGESSVWRLEFQIRGDALSELNARDLMTLADRLDPIWNYLTGAPPRGRGAWLRLIDRASASRKERCSLDARWLPFQQARFNRDSLLPAVRQDARRGGVPLANALGNMLSFLAASGKLSEASGWLPERVIAEDFFRLTEAIVSDPGLVKRYVEQRDGTAAKFARTS